MKVKAIEVSIDGRTFQNGEALLDIDPIIRHAHTIVRGDNGTVDMFLIHGPHMRFTGEAAEIVMSEKQEADRADEEFRANPPRTLPSWMYQILQLQDQLLSGKPDKTAIMTALQGSPLWPTIEPVRAELEALFDKLLPAGPIAAEPASEPLVQ